MEKLHFNLKSKLWDWVLAKRGLIPYTINYVVNKHLDKGQRRILDLGCGDGATMRSLPKCRGLFSIGVDIHPHSLFRAKSNRTYKEYILADIRKLPFKDKAFDVALCIEALEHLEKNEALDLLQDMERITRKQIIISTPVGECKQSTRHGGNLFEEHRSQWQPEEFIKMGYTVRGIGLPILRGEDKALDPRHLPGILKPFRYIIWVMVGPLVYLRPRSAGNMVAAKNL